MHSNMIKTTETICMNINTATGELRVKCVSYNWYVSRTGEALIEEMPRIPPDGFGYTDQKTLEGRWPQSALTEGADHNRDQIKTLPVIALTNKFNDYINKQKKKLYKNYPMKLYTYFINPTLKLLIIIVRIWSCSVAGIIGKYLTNLGSTTRVKL